MTEAGLSREELELKLQESLQQNKKLQQENEALQREMKLLSLRRKVTPHFLFNSVSVAVSLVMREPQKAMRFLRHLAAMYRYLLGYDNEYYVPIKEEIKMLLKYYELMEIRHLGCIRLHIEPEVLKLKDFSLPPLTLQGLLENAIKHNIHTKGDPLEIRFYTQDDCLCVSNRFLPLLTKRGSTQIGLAYVNEIMKLLCNRELTIKNDGETFVVMLPLVKM